MNASFISRFGLDGVEVIGLNEYAKEYKPILIVFENEKVECEVIKSFSTYTSELVKDEDTKSYNYNVISWRKEHKDGKLSLREYCPKYLELKKSPSNKIKDGLSNAQIVKNVFETIGNICSNEIIEYHDDYVTSKNIKGLVYCDEENKNIVQKMLLTIINGVITQNYDSIFIELASLLKCILEIFNIEETEIESVVTKYGAIDFNGLTTKDENLEKCSDCNLFGSVPTLGTVHSIKGETHDITLFLESYFNRNYESDILAEILSGKETAVSLIEKVNKECADFIEEINQIQEQGKTRGIKTRVEKIDKCKRKIITIQQYSKLVYVALSRAKSIVGYAISKTNYEKNLKDIIDSDEWDIHHCD
jgi:hypothetical protein